MAKKSILEGVGMLLHDAWTGGPKLDEWEKGTPDKWSLKRKKKYWDVKKKAEKRRQSQINQDLDGAKSLKDVQAAIGRYQKRARKRSQS